MMISNTEAMWHFWLSYALRSWEIASWIWTSERCRKVSWKTPRCMRRTLRCWGVWSTWSSAWTSWVNGWRPGIPSWTCGWETWMPCSRSCWSTAGPWRRWPPSCRSCGPRGPWGPSVRRAARLASCNGCGGRTSGYNGSWGKGLGVQWHLQQFQLGRSGHMWNLWCFSAWNNWNRCWPLCRPHRPFWICRKRPVRPTMNCGGFCWKQWPWILQEFRFSSDLWGQLYLVSRNGVYPPIYGTFHVESDGFGHTAEPVKATGSRPQILHTQ